MARLAAKTSDPLEKTGIVGAFCRTYDVACRNGQISAWRIRNVILTINVTPSQEVSTTAARCCTMMEILYSHHATDPCSNKLVDAFDLVRLHRFGDLDEEAKPETPSNRLPSFEQMSG